MDDCYYTVMHINVDGAGFYEDRTQPFHCGMYPARKWSDKAFAIAFAEAEQAVSNLDGDPWRYRYIVYCVCAGGYRRDQVHETRPVCGEDPALTPPEGSELNRLRLITWFRVMGRHGAVPLQDLLQQSRMQQDAPSALVTGMRKHYQCYGFPVPGDDLWLAVAAHFLSLP